MKHLISLIDGTWISPNRIGAGETHSNIYKINLLLADDFAADRKQQIVFYSRGLGAVSGVRRYTSGGFAYGIKEEIEDVYINIASNYVRGDTNDSSDKIYLYGFSRGAVIARVVAALISNIGLLFPWEIDAFPKIWRLYREKQVFLDYHRPPECHKRADIEFLGVFDTVYGGNDDDASAARRLQFAGRVLSKNVKNALHILAIDEQRPFFRPLLWAEVSDPHTAAHKGMKQIWMPGVHADIGGVSGGAFLGQMSLLTMIDATTAKTALAFDEYRLRKLRSSVEDSYLAKNVSVSNEWSRFWSLATAATLRSKFVRKPTTQGASQSLHFLCKQLRHKSFTVRRKRPEYDYDPSFEECPIISLPETYNWTWDPD